MPHPLLAQSLFSGRRFPLVGVAYRPGIHRQSLTAVPNLLPNRLPSAVQMGRLALSTATPGPMVLAIDTFSM